MLISGVNLTEGGPLSIMVDAVKSFAQHYLQRYKLVLLVNNKNLFLALHGNPAIEIFEYTYPKKSWLLKLWFEYVHCGSIAKKIKPDVWFSIHDVTPFVKVKNSIVYCHNPAPFYKLTLKEIWNEKTLFFFHFFYSFIYRINIRKNNFVIVQQQWMREEFIKRYKVDHVIVAYPDIRLPQVTSEIGTRMREDIFRFYYPALPRSFKNFEVILLACDLLYPSIKNFEVVFTIDGTENSYASTLVSKYKHLDCIKFIGRQSREQTMKLYQESNCMIFSSKMETWGLPITEAKFFNKPMLVADERYAHETVGNYDKVCFFKKDDYKALGALMTNAINGNLHFQETHYKQPPQPFARSWTELFEMILAENKDVVQKDKQVTA